MRARFESEVGGEYDWTLEAMSKRYLSRGVTYVGDGYVTAQALPSSIDQHVSIVADANLTEATVG